jgi:ankyrin repeat protein
VAATCGAIEVESLMCKYEACDINPVDGFGHTPLDNARMTKQRAIAALLEQAGALPGSTPELQEKASKVQSRIKAELRAGRIAAVLRSLPEQSIVSTLLALVAAQKSWVQACSEIAVALVLHAL